MEQYQPNCELCGKDGRIVVHHKDGNHFNDVPSNRQRLCYRCHLVEHRRADQGKGDSGKERLPLNLTIPISFEEVRRQYFACFPRV